MLYKLTIYLQSNDQLLPVHIFYSEDRQELVNRSRYHESFNDSYVSILITYEASDVEVVQTRTW